MGSVFISYAHEDEAKARKIKERLEEFGFKAWAFGTAPARRDDISTVIDAEIDRVDCVLVLWSKNSRNSVWVRGEALRGLAANKYFGLLLDPLIPPVPFNALAAPDLSEWTGLNMHPGWDALVRGLAGLSSARATILKALTSRQTAEREGAERLVEAQAKLPIDEPEEPEEALDEGPKQSDIEAIVSNARSLIARSAKIDLAGAITQAALDQEMLRDAAFVVSGSDDIAKPSGAHFEIVRTLSKAVTLAADGDLIVVCQGRFEECVRITKNVRIVGLGLGADRPTIAADRNQSTITLNGAVRLENLSIETRHPNHAVLCERGQPAILRCDIRRFAEADKDDETDAGFYVSMRANPIVISSSIASTGCRALLFTSSSGGLFLGVSIVAMRGDAMTCRGHPEFQACSIEAIGASAVRVLGQGAPTLEACDISGRGAPVIYARNRAYPKVAQSRVNAIRQLAFDFDDSASGRYEGNIVSVETDSNAGTGRNDDAGFFARFKSKENALIKRAKDNRQFAQLRGRGRPLFISNTTPDGQALAEPASFAGF